MSVSVRKLAVPFWPLACVLLSTTLLTLKSATSLMSKDMTYDSPCPAYSSGV